MAHIQNRVVRVLTEGVAVAIARFVLGDDVPSRGVLDDSGTKEQKRERLKEDHWKIRLGDMRFERVSKTGYAKRKERKKGNKRRSGEKKLAQLSLNVLANIPTASSKLQSTS